ncbi:hypothetical protein BN11_1200011 [Nostocoides australiense Ben110]|uniref:Uncharacterized protein n=1 Tax=Nostocoides australiense Ben110 TaxID=1193182 RepID=W6JSK0_9MICO|nr:hypothetical protein BN11_1200011 [Tetrasphaera australiensis Ben110]
MAVSGLMLPRPVSFCTQELFTHDFGSVRIRDRFLP